MKRTSASPARVVIVTREDKRTRSMLQQQTLSLCFIHGSNKWEEHFAWQQNGLYIVGLTSTGRVTIAALQMNNPFVVRSCQVWIEASWHPPQDGPR
jgi:hypothetical protein